jgi:hypothetical protein
MPFSRRSLLKTLTSAGSLAAGVPGLAAAAGARGAGRALVLVDLPANGAAAAWRFERIAARFDAVVLSQDWYACGHAVFADAGPGGEPSAARCAMADREAAAGLAAYLGERGFGTLYVAGHAGDRRVACIAGAAREAGCAVCVVETAAGVFDPDRARAAVAA